MTFSIEVFFLLILVVVAYLDFYFHLYIEEQCSQYSVLFSLYNYDFQNYIKELLQASFSSKKDAEEKQDLHQNSTLAIKITNLNNRIQNKTRIYYHARAQPLILIKQPAKIYKIWKHQRDLYLPLNNEIALMRTHCWNPPCGVMQSLDYQIIVRKYLFSQFRRHFLYI